MNPHERREDLRFFQLQYRNPVAWGDTACEGYLMAVIGMYMFILSVAATGSLFNAPTLYALRHTP